MKYVPLLLLLFITINVDAQHEVHPSKDKAVVYFVRSKSMGTLINFTYFDGDKVIGKFNGRNYFRYECEPGKHLFWARSENKSFVEAELEANKIYMLEAIPRMGGVKAAVKLVPVDIGKHKMKNIKKLFENKEPLIFEMDEIVNTQSEMSEVIARAMEKYDKDKDAGKSIPKLDSQMYITREDLESVDSN
ncbi:hypothetical protein [Flagellimonas meishanensis]|uniref:hypothetical protein n=1 Tax=Flagellimonas meishanensis TaxID=2873264 RepID=UPI001CA70C22|nr:hypothetical protein [[Muricauda] meishanensis]